MTLIEGEGADRFYVMSLEDFNTGTNYCWYDGAYGAISDYSTVTSLNFGTGKSNTAKMIAKWNSGAYGAKNDGSDPDIWGVIQKKLQKGGLCHLEENGEHLEIIKQIKIENTFKVS